MSLYIKYPTTGVGILEFATFGDFPASSIDGTFALDQASSDLYVYDGGWIRIGGPGSAGTSMGPFGTSPNDDGGTISLGVLTLQPADGTHPGGVSTTTQTFAGNKTFSGTISASNLSGTNTGDITLGTANGLSLVSQALSLGLSSTITTGALSSTDWNTFNGKQSTVSFGAFGSTPNANGGSISSGVITLQPANGTNPGGITTVAQTIAGAKTFSAAPIFSAATASQVLAVDGSKALTSLAYDSANTLSALVQRDASGNFSAGTITAALTGAASGNTTITPSNHAVVVSSATNALSTVTPVAGAVLWQQFANQNPVMSTTPELGVASTSNGQIVFYNAAGAGGARIQAPSAISSTYNFNLPIIAGTSGQVLTSAGGGGTAMTWTTSTSANTASAIVQRDGSGNFSAGTASLTGASITGVLGVGTTTPLVGTVEQLINSYVTTAGGTANGAMANRLTLSGNTAVSAGQRGMYSDYLRAITTSTTDSSNQTSFVARLLFDVAAGQTLTCSSALGYTALGIVGTSIANGGAVAGNVFGLQHFGDATTVTGYKAAIKLSAISGGTNNALITDNVAFTGSFAINLASANASVLAGALTVGTRSTIQASTGDPGLFIRKDDAATTDLYWGIIDTGVSPGNSLLIGHGPNQSTSGFSTLMSFGYAGAINLPNLTASTALALDSSKNIVSVVNTGSGNNVLSSGPTLTGTMAAAAGTFSGTLGVTGILSVTSNNSYISLSSRAAGTANGTLLFNNGTGQNFVLSETASDVYSFGKGAAGAAQTPTLSLNVNLGIASLLGTTTSTLSFPSGTNCTADTTFIAPLWIASYPSGSASARAQIAFNRSSAGLGAIGTDASSNLILGSVATAGNGIITTIGLSISTGGSVVVAGTTAIRSAILTANGSITARNSGVDASYADAFIASYLSNGNEHNVIQSAVSSTAASSGFRFKASDGAGLSTTTNVLDLTRGQTIFYTGGTQRASIDSSGNLNVVNLTASRAVVTDGSKNLASSGTTATQVGYLSSATGTTGTGALVLNSAPTMVGQVLIQSPGGDPGVFIRKDDAGTTDLYWGIVDTSQTTSNSLIFGHGPGNNITGFTTLLSINYSGAITMSNLAGSGSRAVNADASGTLSAASDSRLKTEVPSAPIPGLDEVMQLQPRAYRWNKEIERIGEENAAVEIGFFANDVAPIIPSAAPMGNDGYYGFYDRSIVAALVKAVQELKAEIEELKNHINGE